MANIWYKQGPYLHLSSLMYHWYGRLRCFCCWCCVHEPAKTWEEGLGTCDHDPPGISSVPPAGAGAAVGGGLVTSGEPKFQRLFHCIPTSREHLHCDWWVSVLQPKRVIANLNKVKLFNFLKIARRFCSFSRSFPLKANDFKVSVLKSPSQSPDLSSVEHLWAELKSPRRSRCSTNLTHLHKFCLDKWSKL